MTLSAAPEALDGRQADGANADHRDNRLDEDLSRAPTFVPSTS